jgi:hypothetical protein
LCEFNKLGKNIYETLPTPPTTDPAIIAVLLEELLLPLGSVLEVGEGAPEVELGLPVVMGVPLVWLVVR